ncbi:GNAT family N-acetyltransferase [Streptomyces sp. NPDC008150]|uniref:GNAT family N-acetyltransferase n=1 Tax=Streptomyces sp. NPDC008150 TaxID=3364816 RepID=UPI0036E32E8C
MSLRVTALTDPAVAPSGRRLAWLASDGDGAPVGSAFLRVPARSGPDRVAGLELHVHPAERRAGIGTRLLDEAVAAGRAEGAALLGAEAEDGSPGDRFLSARGFRRALTLLYARLPLTGAEAHPAALDALAGIVDRPHPGYRLVSWQGTVPDELAGTFVESRGAMDDMPMGDTGYVPTVWDLERVRDAAATVAKRGDLLHTVAAVHEADGAIAGFTELVVPGDGTGDAQHYGTGVLPAHRGHGLALWMKAASVSGARERYPDLAGLLADTADVNHRMRRVNDLLGYRPTHTAHEYRLDL